VRDARVDDGACVGVKAVWKRASVRTVRTAVLDDIIVVDADQCVALMDTGTAITVSFTGQLV